MGQSEFDAVFYAIFADSHMSIGRPNSILTVFAEQKLSASVIFHEVAVTVYGVNFTLKPYHRVTYGNCSNLSDNKIYKHKTII